MDLNITVLGSGSEGNATVVSLGNFGVLIDNGFSKKELLRRLSVSGISPDTIKALIITHEHSDHIKGARIIADALDIETFANTFTANEMRKVSCLGKKHKSFLTGSPFIIENFKITPFRISHDAIESVGFVFETKGIKIGYAMDVGTLDTLTKQRLKGCDVIMLESNHDKKMLMESTRPFYLKKRILSRTGHLDNTEAIGAFSELVTENTRKIMLGHISSDCNLHSIVEGMAVSKLRSMNRSDITVKLMKQHQPSVPVLIS
ncbi:MAG TPA: MBL fold metallo-hydrolase [Lentisphaeria bacterium]|nr:MAG: hypothetical protein A2X47_12195 [Lentisphaerae bacterium GWF2_38_69]HBM17169.1 MBL fold metallo-hydrolase [Lentisphaeria bacterium]